MAGLVKEISRKTDVVARWGGEEIALFLPLTARSEAITIAERLRRLLERTPLQDEQESIKITASFGVADRQAGESFDDLCWRADEQLYKAKRHGRNRVEPALAGDIAHPQA